MSERNDEDRITRGNWIAFAGLLGLTVAMFFGLWLDYVDMPMAVLGGVLFGGVLLLCQFFAIFAKKKTGELLKWHIVEGVCVVAYIAVAVFFAGDCLRALYVATNHKGLQEQANQDADSIAKYYVKYQKWCDDKLKNAFTQLQAFREPGVDQYKYRPLSDYYAKYLTEDDPAIWLQQGRNKVKYADSVSIIRNPNLPDLSYVADQLRAEIENVGEKLQMHIGNLKNDGYIPVIGNNFAFDSTSSYAKFMEPLPAIKFPKMLKSGFSILSMVLYVLLHIFVIVNYLFIHRRAKDIILDDKLREKIKQLGGNASTANNSNSMIARDDRTNGR